MMPATGARLHAARLVAVLGLACTTHASAADMDLRFKAFGSGAALPSHDVGRVQTATPAYDANLDLRAMWRGGGDALTWKADASITWVGGDSFGSFAAPESTLDQSPLDDDRRVFDLTWTMDEGDRHVAVSRFDRLAARFAAGVWSVTAGREAVSWGGGIVFQPMDLFNPFAPTTVDRDYKAGDDLVLLERLFADGSDLQLLVVGRRDEEGRLTGQAFSSGGKWHGFAGAVELELFAAKHYVDEVFGVGLRIPLGGALMRADVVYTDLRDGGSRYTGVLNVDYSLTLRARNLYVFGEYFHNGFGVEELPATPLALPSELTDRLARGELFNLMRDYVAAGVRIEWHPLVNHTISLITNLHDSSSLLQMQVTFEPSDSTRLEFGWVEPLGRAGDEFGGIPVAGDALTVGGGSQLFARWVYYW
jgi:hypothetical protein